MVVTGFEPGPCFVRSDCSKKMYDDKSQHKTNIWTFTYIDPRRYFSVFKILKHLAHHKIAQKGSCDTLWARRSMSLAGVKNLVRRWNVFSMLKKQFLNCKIRFIHISVAKEAFSKLAAIVNILLWRTLLFSCSLPKHISFKGNHLAIKTVDFYSLQ